MGLLATLTDPTLIPATIAAALHLQSTGPEPSLETVAAALAGRNVLLVLDNCEHLIEAAARAADLLLQRAASLRLIATSREPLKSLGEAVYRVPTLSTPERGVIDADAMLRHGAIQLFAGLRATPSRSAGEAGASVTIAEICRRLDGIPLAIELAASQAASLGVEQVAAQLDNHFQLLTAGRRTALPRHRTLRATLDWSYDLLGPEQRALLHLIAAFAGRFTLRDAEAVAENADFRAASVAECLADLVDKSFLIIDLRGATPFYRLYEAMRRYARPERRPMRASLPERAAVTPRAIARQFTQADAEAEQREPADWRAAYSRYLDDVRSALDWAMQPGGDEALGITLTANAVTPVGTTVAVPGAAPTDRTRHWTGWAMRPRKVALAR